MIRILLTAFEPYDVWEANASWLALVELTKDLPRCPRVTTRLYPVNFAAMRQCLAKDLAEGYDYALHLGQAPGATCIQLEAIGVNVGGTKEQRPEEFSPLVIDGPVAYRTSLPLDVWAARLRQAGIPAQVSFHAGTFLCNATLYMSHYLAEQQQLKTRATFVHLPLETEQVIHEARQAASLPRTLTASAIRLLLEETAV